MKKFLLLIIPTLLIVFCFCSIIGTSFAIYKYYKNGEINNILKSGTLIVELEDFDSKITLNSNTISENNSSIITYPFTINNTGTLAIKYRLIIEEDLETYNQDSCQNSKILINNIGYSIAREDRSSTSGTLKDNNIIEIGHLDSTKKQKYVLKVWNLDNKATGHFHGKLKLDYIVESSSFPN